MIIEVTANHNGHFEFKLCANNDVFQDPDQTCFDLRPLRLAQVDELYEDAYKYPIHWREGLGYRQLFVELPLDLACEQCILQWTYIAGNNWGLCANGTSGIGCGDQEHFRACADIRITPRPIINQILLGGAHRAGAEAPEIPRTVPQITLAGAHAKPDSAAKLGFDPDALRVADKRELLMRKKTYLQKLLDELKELILLTEQNPSEAEEGPAVTAEKLEELRSEESEQKIFKPKNQDWSNGYEEDNDVEPWWDRIISNKH